jgi:hypothetical protein
MNQGWSKQLNDQLKIAAELERDILKYLFTDCVEFISRVIRILMDESYGRDNLI